MSAPSPGRKRHTAGIVLLALAASLLAGCMPFSKQPPPLRDYRISYEAPSPGTHTIDGVVHVLPFAVAATYDSRSMLYRQGEVRVSRYPYDRWAANPGNLVADMLARDLDTSDTFRAVQHARTTLASDFRIAGEIDTFEEVAAGDRCDAVLVMRILVVRIGTEDRILLRRLYKAREPSRCDDAPALARAMSRAMEHVSAELRSDILAAATIRP